MFIVDCAWDAWIQWESCSKSCGGGNQERTRSIDIPPANGGYNCTGINTESRDCNTHNCPGKDLICLLST